MDRHQRYLIKQQRVSNNLFSGLMFVLGSIFYAGSFFYQTSETVKKIGTQIYIIKEEPTQKEILKELGLILISSSAVTLIFGWATRADSITTTAAIVNSAIEKAIRPTANFVLENSLRKFRWDCWLGPINEEMITKFSSNYLYQSIHMSYIKDNIDDEIRVIFAVGNKNGILKDYFDDERYIVNYKIECRNEELNVMDEDVCRVIELKLNGKVIPAVTPELETVQGSKVKQYKYKVPENFLESPVIVSILFSVLKWVPGDKRIYIPKQIFETTADSEFRLSVSELVGVRNIIIDTTEVSGLQSTDSIMSSVIQNKFGSDVGGAIFIPEPILKGSSIRFELQRD